jgi:type VI secretion system secreted protein VgrG
MATGSGFGSSPAAGAVQPCPSPTPAHWLEIELLDEDGKPVPGEAYKVTLPSGQEVSGFLNDQGKERLDPVADAGSCQVSFPKLDASAWDAAAGP